ncbi:VOC family protein [Chloroflexota bacterium]
MRIDSIVSLPPISHIGVVVRDLDRSMAIYSSTFGAGPWRVAELTYPDVVIKGEHKSYQVRLAFAEWDSMELELIQPVSGDSLYSDFLNERGEGMHHLGYLVNQEEKAEITTRLAKVGIRPLQESNSSMHSGSFAYFDADKTGGVIIELIHRPAGFQLSDLPGKS